MAKPRTTAQKLEIRRFLEAHRDRDMTVEEITEGLAERGLGIGIATVYRAVKRMEEDGVIVRRVDGARAKAAYRYCGDRSVRNTRAIFCVSCGKNLTLPLDMASRFEGLVSEKTGFSVTDHQILLYGICPDCRSAE